MRKTWTYVHQSQLLAGTTRFPPPPPTAAHRPAHRVRDDRPVHHNTVGCGNAVAQPPSSARPRPPRQPSSSSSALSQDPGRENNYTFQVTRTGWDAFGDAVIYARHEAYGDFQYCVVQLDLDADEAKAGVEKVVVHFADGETICDGVVDVTTGTIVGNVRQLEIGDDSTGEEGFEHPSDEVTHTFTLVSLAAATAREPPSRW